jgi:hypothetical protein
MKKMANSAMEPPRPSAWSHYYDSIIGSIDCCPNHHFFFLRPNKKFVGAGDRESDTELLPSMGVAETQREDSGMMGAPEFFCASPLTSLIQIPRNDRVSQTGGRRG